jgi:hypothetical protein
MLTRASCLCVLFLTGCVVALPSSKPQTPPPVLHSLPQAVWPDECVADWYAKATLPPCVESWITDITKQQKQIEKTKGKAKPKPETPELKVLS